MNDKKQRTETLRKIMEQHKLNAADVGKLLRRAPQTVRSWACANDDRTIPEHMLDLLASKVTAPGAADEQA
jgi:hypothetical protein